MYFCNSKWDDNSFGLFLPDPDENFYYDNARKSKEVVYFFFIDLTKIVK